MDAGTRVGGKRWPYAHAHPDCWNEPHLGTVLAWEDPRALGDSYGAYDAAERARIVAGLRSRGWVAVLWDFGAVYTEEARKLASPADDRAAWVEAREATRRACGPSVGATPVARVA